MLAQPPHVRCRGAGPVAETLLRQMLCRDVEGALGTDEPPLTHADLMTLLAAGEGGSQGPDATRTPQPFRERFTNAGWMKAVLKRMGERGGYLVAADLQTVRIHRAGVGRGRAARRRTVHHTSGGPDPWLLWEPDAVTVCHWREAVARVTHCQTGRC